MSSVTEESFLKEALDIFHKVQQDIEGNEFYKQTKKLYNSIECLPVHRLFSLEDLRWAIKDDMAFRWSTAIRNVSDETFTERLKFTILTTKSYDFYIPIYCLYDFPSGMPLANSTVMTFQDLPTKIQDYFISKWQFRFSIDTEYHHKKEEYVNLKQKSTFFHILIKANGSNKAIENATEIAEDALHIIRFVYGDNFNLIDIRYVVKESGDAGGLEDLLGLPFCGSASYDKMYAQSLDIISGVFSKSNPNDIEKRVKKAVQIFGTQESITNKNVRFILLMTCLETLLLAGSDKDYILWKLAEKTAFVLERDKRDINDFIRKSYYKRSIFIHGGSKKNRETNPISEDDIDKAKQIVGDVIWKLIIDFVGQRHFTCIEKSKKDRDRISEIQSINEFIDEKKFGAKT
jgi:hypothetical protein